MAGIAVAEKPRPFCLYTQATRCFVVATTSAPTTSKKKTERLRPPQPFLFCQPRHQPRLRMFLVPPAASRADSIVWTIKNVSVVTFSSTGMYQVLSLLRPQDPKKILPGLVSTTPALNRRLECMPAYKHALEYHKVKANSSSSADFSFVLGSSSADLGRFRPKQPTPTPTV